MILDISLDIIYKKSLYIGIASILHIIQINQSKFILIYIIYIRNIAKSTSLTYVVLIF